jgi:hypothetical protein
MEAHGVSSLYLSCRSYGKNVEVDYRGSEVSVANFITVLTGTHVYDLAVFRWLGLMSQRVDSCPRLRHRTS